jgi:hypothetical protein
VLFNDKRELALLLILIQRQAMLQSLIDLPLRPGRSQSHNDEERRDTGAAIAQQPE